MDSGPGSGGGGVTTGGGGGAAVEMIRIGVGDTFAALSQFKKDVSWGLPSVNSGISPGSINAGRSLLSIYEEYSGLHLVMVRVLE